MLYNLARFLILLALIAGGLFINACTRKTLVEKAPDPGYFERAKFILQLNAGFTKFNDYLQRCGLLDSLAGEGPFTVFAPGDDAFKNILYPLDTITTLKERMRYHILKGAVSLKRLPLGMNQELPAADGKKLWVSRWLNGTDTLSSVNGCPVSTADIKTSNGYVNVLADVIDLQTHSHIEDMIKNDQSLTFFSTALSRTGLFDYIKANKNITILAPDNAAFRSGGIASMERVLAMDIDSLTRLMKHHLMPGRKFINDVKTDIGNGNNTCTMLDGTTITASVVRVTRQRESVAWQSNGAFINPRPLVQAGTRISYPADDAILHRVSTVVRLW